MSTVLDALKWRYATKKFDPTKNVSDQDILKIKESIQLAATSYGLQAFEVLFITNKEIRQQLTPVSWGQTQIEDASHVVVFCNKTDVSNDYIDEFIRLKAEFLGQNPEDLKGYADFMKNTISGLPAEAVNVWNSKQTYICLANLMTICGELKVDACPMEGFEAEKYNEILGLSEKGLNAALVATIGYRSDEDPIKDVPKFRRSMESLFTDIH